MKYLMELAAQYGPAQPLSNRDAWEIESMLAARDRLKKIEFCGPANSIISEWLVRKAMSLRGWRSPYEFFQRTNSPGLYILISYHHPAQLCWSWLISLQVGRRVQGRRLWSAGFGRYTLRLPKLVQISFVRQPYDWMLSINAEQLLRLLCAHNRESAKLAA